MIRILLVDDQQLVREGLRMRIELEADLMVIGEAGNGDTALELAQTLYPDVVVMDVEMPGMDGIATTGMLRALQPDLPVVILSLYDDVEKLERAKAAGAAAFVQKGGESRSLVEAIRLSARRSD